jgi:hypothetical protein
MQNYRKIWETHFGKIPKDENNRSYEIHHKDGNRFNNDISNLECLSIQEHYDIHYAQGDLPACIYIASRMNISSNNISALARKQQLQKVANGTHPWLNKEAQSKRAKQRVVDGTCPLSRRDDGTSHATDRVKAGTHHFLGGKIQSKNSKNRVDAGTHNFQNKEFAIKNVMKQLENNRHPLK